MIANKACADLYGLEILQESIHDLKHNLTLFLGVKKTGEFMNSVGIIGFGRFGKVLANILQKGFTSKHMI